MSGVFDFFLIQSYDLSLNSPQFTLIELIFVILNRTLEMHLKIQVIRLNKEKGLKKISDEYEQ